MVETDGGKAQRAGTDGQMRLKLQRSVCLKLYIVLRFWHFCLHPNTKEVTGISFVLLTALKSTFITLDDDMFFQNLCPSYWTVFIAPTFYRRNSPNKTLLTVRSWVIGKEMPLRNSSDVIFQCSAHCKQNPFTAEISEMNVSKTEQTKTLWYLHGSIPQGKFGVNWPFNCIYQWILRGKLQILPSRCGSSLFIFSITDLLSLNNDRETSPKSIDIMLNGHPKGQRAASLTQTPEVSLYS